MKFLSLQYKPFKCHYRHLPPSVVIWYKYVTVLFVRVLAKVLYSTLIFYPVLDICMRDSLNVFIIFWEVAHLFLYDRYIYIYIYIGQRHLFVYAMHIVPLPT